MFGMWVEGGLAARKRLAAITVGMCLMTAAVPMISGCGHSHVSDFLGGSTSNGNFQFSSVTTTNADTTSATDTNNGAQLQNGIYNASLTASGSGLTDRVVDVHLAAANDAALAAGSTFSVVNSTTLAAGQASVTYIEEGTGFQKFWDGTGGTVQVVSHDSKQTTLKVINATMVPLNNYGAAVEPTGTFTINAYGQF